MNNNITRRHRSKLRELVQLVLQKSSTKLSTEISEIVEGSKKNQMITLNANNVREAQKIFNSLSYLMTIRGVLKRLIIRSLYYPG